LILGALGLLFWQTRIIDEADLGPLTLRSVDTYIEHYPTAWYGFEVLRSGAIPLWNPYQLCGLPFMAVPSAGLFYPGNFAHLPFDTGLATEIVLIAHQILGGLGMWLLARTLGLSASGALAGALTFMWSGWMIHSLGWPSRISNMSWLPVTVLAIERTIRGGRWATYGLIVAVSCQLLNGATEYHLHNMYVGALFATFRLPRVASQVSLLVAGQRALILLGCVTAGVALSAAQLMPSIELVGQTLRAGATLTLAQVRATGWIAPRVFLAGALESTGIVSVVAVSLLGLGLGLRFKGFRTLWLFSLTTAIAAALLVLGGSVFELYYKTPFGDMFRRPWKFLDIYVFAMSLMGAIALTRLDYWRWLRITQLWSRTGWIACTALLGAGLICLWRLDTSNPYLAASLVLILLFGLISKAQIRMAVVLALLVMQGSILFFGVSDSIVRLAEQSEVFDRRKDLLEGLKQAAGHERIYISDGFTLCPDLTAKQGMLRRFRSATDYQPLSMSRYATFFNRVSGERLARRLFAGSYRLGEDSRWPLMDLTSTRYYVVRRGTELDEFLFRSSRHPQSSGFQLVRDPPGIRVYERSRYLPRAYYVPNARVVGSSEEVLAELAGAGLDPRRVVLLETAPQQDVARPVPAEASGAAQILVDEPERVVVNVDTEQPGFLVLTDAFYPGWKAHADGRELHIHRANYLFRAVQIRPGRTRVTFKYQDWDHLLP
jgi:hypothetical protein